MTPASRTRSWGAAVINSGMTKVHLEDTLALYKSHLLLSSRDKILVFPASNVDDEVMLHLLLTAYHPDTFDRETWDYRCQSRDEWHLNTSGESDIGGTSIIMTSPSVEM